ncbi:kinase-related family [Trichomonas vaginalis G3]|uniref:kinase-related family n=1 Tax=Trichomonas vaginalis (strain ATCC PRA-98 / G3) TaxID=412133 RepID=UPI0021E5356C|nr:kinase-related family [Trichomonas vaginalis G3]KAI5537378.1 kinase-related family [Trichomonas vaginalis G3]
MTKITDAATRQAVQSAYDAVRATVVESQEKELQQTKTDLVNAFLKTKSQVGHYAADGTYVPAGGTYIPPNPPREAPAPGLPKTFTSSHGHRHRHAQQPAQQPPPQPAQQPTQQPAQQPTVQNPAQQQPQTEQGHKRSREQGNQEFLKMLKEECGFPDSI